MILRIISKSVLLPPFAQILGLFVAFFLWRRYKRLAFFIGFTSIFSLLLLSTQLVSRELMASLESRHAPIDVPAMKSIADSAIVILGGGRMSSAPEYNNRDTLSVSTLIRVRYGAHLSRQASIPILVTGGAVLGETISEAELMRDVLVEEFNTPVKWIESQSKNTYENAKFSAELLHAEGVKNIVLVTQAYHMPRSVAVFEQQGFTIIPAPTSFESGGDPALWELLLPKSSALDSSSRAIHEWLGIIVYRLIY